MIWWGNWNARTGAVALLVLAGAALGAPFLAPYDPIVQDRVSYHLPPAAPPADCGVRWWVLDSTGARHLFGFDNCRIHVLGTDSVGRDVLSRVLHGARRSLVAATLGVAFTVALGTVVGAVSGFLGGLTDRFFMRFAELLMALPALYLVLAVRNLFPDDISPAHSSLIVVGCLSVVGWCGVARVIRAQVLIQRERDFVAAAAAAGASETRVLFRHILPNVLPFVLLQAGLTLPYFLLGEAALSYLGLGVQEPEPSLGNMIASAAGEYTAVTTYWWTLAAPGAALTLAVLAANLWIEGARRVYLGRGAAAGPADSSGAG